jgi:hypothetical protein
MVNIMSNASQTRLLNSIKKKTSFKSGGRLYIDDLSLKLANVILKNEDSFNEYKLVIISDGSTYSDAARLRNSGNDKVLFLFAGGKMADSYFTSCANQITFPKATFDKAEKEMFS